MRATLLLGLLLSTVCGAAERRWQSGVWADVTVTRQTVDFGPGSTSFGPPASPSMRAMADVCVYVIETPTERLEFKEVVRMGRSSVSAVVGQPVKFAVEKNSIYVKGTDGKERKLRLTRKTPKSPSI